ncbi:MAG: dihydrolipoyllysine-residue acetyltransferase [Gammaproteobacteria bacterium]|nr:dihydrolipoyllysine-residue acetyltransferase [Gammaproteobacteria bacterium]
MADLETIKLPDVGDFDEIEIIEVLIVPGDEIQAEDSIIVLESDKATMEIPSPQAGTIKSVLVNAGDRISEGSNIATIEVITAEGKVEVPIKEEPAEQESESPPAPEKMYKPPVASPPPDSAGNLVHASPSIRRYARELGVNLDRVIGSGPKGRILKADIKAFIKTSLAGGTTSAGTGIPIAVMPDIDFSKFGEIEAVDLNRIKKISGAHLHRSWVTVPHVTQFDEADITDLEAFRKSLAKEAEKRGVRLTLLVFLMKSVISALKALPNFNASLESSGERLVLKKYFNIGVAVDTPNGLMVPVIRDVDQKGLFDLAEELSSIAAKARDGKLAPADMQGGCFSISSLGGIGGSHFTPIVNAPEVAILGVGKAKMQAVYQDDGSFMPNLILPLALSYDHRVIDGAQGARFTSYLSQVITDIRRVLL